MRYKEFSWKKCAIETLRTYKILYNIMIVDVLIPARLKSKRLKNKPLIKVGRLTLIEHVIERVKLSKLVNSVTVCADDKKFLIFSKSKNHKCILTSKNLKNGTERIASVLKNLNLIL